MQFNMVSLNGNRPITITAIYGSGQTQNIFSGTINNDSFKKTVYMFVTPSNETSMQLQITCNQTQRIDKVFLGTQADYNVMQSLGIDWFDGDTYQGSGFRFPVDFGAAGVDGRARFTNEGTAPTSVRFRVSGGLPDGFSLRCVETGDVLTFRRPVASDDYVLLDSSDGSALLNGVSPVSGYLTDDDWWQVGPGETCTVQFTSLGGVQGSPLLVLSGSPAYF